ncbi:alpha-hydroxy-acid oxidizing protein [Salinisphaera sp. SPP-AMP-43]|uniref:alpha-hydroxy-acid oxidizing protein n=1 Tax=Salinisphaera sp. SPP-AMP-43 TaxID=3121288 RepID=UPI003C6DBFA1
MHQPIHARRDPGGGRYRRRLSPVVAEVGETVEVYVSGGFRTGRHVLGAMGARAAVIGWPALWALAIGGDAGLLPSL